MPTCGICEGDFKTPAGLKTHKTRMHSGNVTDTTPKTSFCSASLHIYCARTVDGPCGCFCHEDGIPEERPWHTKAFVNLDPALICTYCAKDFKTKQGLRSHMTRQHKDDT